jgi:predicted dehydrogenase
VAPTITSRKDGGLHRRPVTCGVVGCGKVSGQYLRAMADSPVLDVVACADLDPARANAAAAAYQVPNVVSTAELLADAAVELVVNLTPPQRHAEVNLQAIQAGKSVYTEKPLAVTRQEGLTLLQKASAHGLLVGCAPDTFLAPPAQTARHAIDQGLIGTPIAAAAAILGPGHERWFPEPEVFYRRGAGPLMDLGIYHLTTLVSLLGPVRQVYGMHETFSPIRSVEVGPRAGSTFRSEVPTHYAALLQFEQGTIATIAASFEVWRSGLPDLEVYGTHGTLALPDPNFFTGPVRRWAARGSSWTDLPDAVASPRRRGVGVVDLAHALRGVGRQRASGALGLHVLDVMLAIETAWERGTAQRIRSTCPRPPPLPPADGSGDCIWCRVPEPAS